jgi:asparagine synthase (glutamine-hydrolysing)
MCRYVAIIWDASSPQQTSAAELALGRLCKGSAAWTTTCVEPGLRVALYQRRGFGFERDFYQLDSGGGLILGTLFSRASDETFGTVAGPTLGASISSAIVATAARELVNAYWGAYVAFVRDADKQSTYVLRDPSGTVSCYRTLSSGMTVLFSHAEDYEQLALTSLSINWTATTALAAGISLQTAQTPLDHVTQVRPGECIEIRGDRCNSSWYWTPMQVARSGGIEDVQAAVRDLKRVIVSCVNAWAARHRRIVHSVSGGLDSSIVMACLQQVPTALDTIYVNYYEEAVEGDERRFARLLAKRYDCKVIERLTNASSVNLDLAFEASPTVFPAHYVHELLHAEFELELERDRGVTAFFQGGGGDGVLLQAGAEFAPSDYVFQHGLRPGLWRVAHDAARITRLSAAALVRRGIAAGFRGPRWRPEFGALAASSFVNAGVADDFSGQAGAIAPPWLEAADDIPDGKRYHIFVSSFPPAYCRPFRRFERADMVFPLLSQPVHELCLRIPTYILFHGGWDRSIARRAFAAELPGEIVNRRGKGGADALLSQILARNVALIQQTLLDGELARQGILDRRNLERFLAKPRFDGSAAISEVIDLFEMEVFLQSWRGARLRAAA